jgi:alkylhydroperoxidase/carboxymuconolactone decarboxylase family protein YurZ
VTTPKSPALLNEGGTSSESKGATSVNEKNPNQAAGPWNLAVAQLREWDPTWADACVKMTTNPWVDGVLPRKFIELVGVALNAACTNLNPEGTRRHVRAALEAGATCDEILTILKMASAMAIHSCSLGAPILLEEAKAAGAKPAAKTSAPTPACDNMRSVGQWNVAWDPFFALDPVWTDQFMATCAGIYGSGIFTPKEVELLSIAFDASYTHMYAPGTRRHIKGALAPGATIEEIMEILKLCVVQGVQACNLGIPILAEELERSGQQNEADRSKAKMIFDRQPTIQQRNEWR